MRPEWLPSRNLSVTLVRSHLCCISRDRVIVFDEASRLVLCTLLRDGIVNLAVIMYKKGNFGTLQSDFQPNLATTETYGMDPVYDSPFMLKDKTCCIMLYLYIPHRLYLPLYIRGYTGIYATLMFQPAWILPQVHSQQVMSVMTGYEGMLFVKSPFFDMSYKA